MLSGNLCSLNLHLLFLKSIICFYQMDCLVFSGKKRGVCFKTNLSQEAILSEKRSLASRGVTRMINAGKKRKIEGTGMIAIPVEKSGKTEAKIVGLYGNAEYFAFYDEGKKDFKIITNAKAGNGIDTAKFLVENGATKTAYIHLGNGPFGELEKNGIEVFYVGKEEMPVSAVAEGIATGKFEKVTPANAAEMLDPGTPSGDCSCGCSH